VFWFSISVSVSIYILLFFSAPFIARFYGEPALVPLARFLFLSFVISSTATAHSAYLFKNLLVKKRSLSQLWAQLLSGVVGITAAYNGMAYWGIALHHISYTAITSIFYWGFTPWRPSLSINFRPLREMFGFSSRVLATNVFIHINNNIFSVLLGRFFSVVQVGFYSQAAKWNMMGYNTINGMIGSVAQPVLAQVIQDRERQLAVFRRMLRFTAFTAFPLMLGLAFISRELIVVCVTDKWIECVPMMQLLCLWGAFFPVQTLFSNLIISSGKSYIYMWNTIVLCLLQIGVLIVMAPFGIYPMIVTFVAVNIAWQGVWYLFARKQIALRFIDFLKDVLPFAVIALGTIAATYYLTRGIGNIYLLLVAKVFVAALIYILIMWVFRVEEFRESLAFLRGKLFCGKK
ncbi:MAG: lipopolysaccharide biosynthesis protein, partial [Porphyromonadaceae bacterium]|nr:lipopolysaccharide biosynthesis protein [Porphyromonadaceae bacterium]